MKPRHFLIMLSLGFVLLLSDQFVFSFGITMGENFKYAQTKQSEDASPEIDIAPRMRTCDRIPSRYPTHDELPELFLVAGISFLIGFRIAAWMGKRHLERMREIWHK